MKPTPSDISPLDANPHPLPYLHRPELEARVQDFLQARLRPLSSGPCAYYLAGPPGVGKRTLLRTVFAGDSAFSAYARIDATTEAILRPGARDRSKRRRERGTAATTAVISAFAGPLVALAAALGETFGMDWLTPDDPPHTRYLKVVDLLLEQAHSPQLWIVADLDPSDMPLLAALVHLINELALRQRPVALFILDAQDVAGTYVVGNLLKDALRDPDALHCERVEPLAEKAITEQLTQHHVPLAWARLCYQFSEGFPGPLALYWRRFQKGGLLRYMGGYWQAVRPASGVAQFPIVRDVLFKLVGAPRPSGGSLLRDALIDAFLLAAGMGQAFVAQAVAEVAYAVLPQLKGHDADAWEDLWFDVLLYEDETHPALVRQPDGPGLAAMLAGQEITAGPHKGYRHNYDVYSFRDALLTDVLFRTACRYVRREQQAGEQQAGEQQAGEQQAGEQRAREDGATGVLAAGFQELQLWLDRHAAADKVARAPFEEALYRVQGQSWRANEWALFQHRERLLSLGRPHLNHLRRQVRYRADAWYHYVMLLWYADHLNKGGDYRLAHTYYEEAYRLSENGDVHLSAVQRATLLNAYGNSCHRLGAYEQADGVLREALQIREAVLGQDHPSTLGSVNNLAYLLNARGHYAEAEALYRRALEGYERVLGQDHPSTLGSVNNLAYLLNARGRYVEAEPLLMRALEGYERVLGQDHPDTLMSVNNLAALLDDTGRYAEAEPLYRRALEGSERVLGQDHPSTLGSVNNLAALLNATGRYVEAEPLYRRALEGSERVLGQDHPDTLMSVNNLAYLLNARGRYVEAEPLYRRALEGYERVLGQDHPSTLLSVNNLAGLLESTGRYAEAEPLLRRALEGKERVLGQDHPSTLLSVNNLGSFLVGIGRCSEGLPYMRQATQRARQHLGGEHPYTTVFAGNLEDAEARCRDANQADPTLIRPIL